MANSGECRMNLTALQRVDSKIKAIIDNASQVALYKFSPRANEWEKTEIEGTLFVYLRSEIPHHGFIIMNRLNTTNLTEPITEEIEFQLQSPFLLYRNAKCNIYGIWFYENNECTRLGQLMNRMKSNLPMGNMVKKDIHLYRGISQQNNISVKQEKNGPHRLRCVSESDSRKSKEKKSGKSSSKDIDIISLLSHAQNEYDKKSNHSTSCRPVDKNEPKKVIKIITEGGQCDKDVIKPTPVRANSKTTSAVSAVTPLSVDSLFAQASRHNQEFYSLENSSAFPRNQDTPLRTRSFSSAGSFDTKAKDNAGTILQRLLSNPANTVEHIEKLQRNEASNREDKRKRSDTDVNTSLINLEQPVNLIKSNQQSVQSLEQDIKEQLKIISGDNAKKDAASPTMPVTCNRSPTITIEESNMEKHCIEQLNTRISPKQDSSIQTILTPAAFENCMSQNQFLDISTTDLLSTSLDSSILSNDAFLLAARSLKSLPQNTNTQSQEMTLISPMAFVARSNNTSVTPLLDNSNTVDILSTNNSQLDPLTGLLLPHHLINGVVPPISNSKQTKEVKPGISPLTRDQLKEALLYMLQNDAEFLSKIHESYIHSWKMHINSMMS